MRLRSRGVLLVACVLAICASVTAAMLSGRPTAEPAASLTPAAVDGPRRIMPLGDSITEGEFVPGGYRVRLSLLLAAASTRFEFVGSLSEGPEVLADKRHEGHPGWCLAVCRNNLDDHLTEWLTAARPDVVLLHAGTNDLWAGTNPAEVTRRLETVVDHIYRDAPNAHVYVAQIRRGGEFNRGVADVVARAKAQGRFAVVVDMSENAGFGDAYYVDGVHPNATGADQMAYSWFAALQANGF